MTLKILAEKKDCGLAAAKVAAAKIRTAIAERGECRIILATGISQYDMLTQLATEPGIDWGKVGEAEIVCENLEDESKLFRLNLFGHEEN